MRERGGSLPVLGPRILSLPIGQPLEALALATQQKMSTATAASYPWASADKATGSMARSLTGEGLERAWAQLTGAGKEAMQQEQQPQQEPPQQEQPPPPPPEDAGARDGKVKRAKRRAPGEASRANKAHAGRGRPGQPDSAGGPGPRCSVCCAPARFKLAGGNKFVHGFCGTHAEATMVDIRGPVCDFPDCTRPNAPVAKRATYALPGEGKPRRCSKHREEGMVDVVHKAAAGASGADTLESLGGEDGATQEQPPAKRGRSMRGRGRKQGDGQPALKRGASASTITSLLSSASSSSSSLAGSGADGSEAPGREGGDAAASASASQHRAKSSTLGSTASLLAAALTMGSGDDLQGQGQMGAAANASSTLDAARSDLRRLAQQLAATPSTDPEQEAAALARLLREPDIETRTLVLGMLGRLGTPAADAVVRDGILLDACPDVRRWAVYALGHLGPLAAGYEAAVAPLLRDADWGVRQWAAFALGQMGTAAARDSLLPALASLLVDAKADVRCAALEALERLEGAAVAGAGGAGADERASSHARMVAPLVHDPEPKVQMAAVAVLAGCGERAAPYAEPLALLLAAPAPELAHAAEEALPKLGAAVGGELIRLGLLTHWRTVARGAALRVLGKLGAVGAWPHVEQIRARLGDEDESVRLSATDALVRLAQGPGDGAAGPAALVEAADRCLGDLAGLLGTDGSLEVRARALRGFLGVGARAGPHVGAVARMLLEDPEPFARSVALDTLCCLGGELALPYMACVVRVLREDGERLVVSRAVYHLSTGVWRDHLPVFAREIALALVEVLRDGRIDQSQMSLANSLLAFCMDQCTKDGAAAAAAVEAAHAQGEQIPSTETLFA